MDSFEISKLAGAVLCAALVIVGTKTFIDIAMSEHAGDHDVVGYVLEGRDDGTEAATAASGHGASEPGVGAKAPAAFDPSTVVAAVAGASAAGGEALFKKCRGCHTAAQGQPAKIGPNLWGVVERAKAGVEGFGYSAAMSGKGGAWTMADLASFLHKPKAFVPGTKMIFKGFRKDGDLANMLAYLATLK